MHRFRSLVGCFQLRVHPFVAEESRAIFRDAIPTHQTDRFAHHLCAPAGVPQLGCGAKNVGQRVQQNETQKRIGFQLRSLGVVGRQSGWQADEIRRPFRRFALQLRARSRAGDSLSRQQFVSLALQRIEFIEGPCRRKSKRCAGLAGRPDVHQPVQRVFASLQPEFITHRSWRRRLRATEPPSLIPYDRLNRREQFRRRHNAHGHARPAKHGFNDLAVVVARQDDAIFHVVAADNPARRNAQAENRIAGRRKLMHQLSRGRAAIECAGIAFFQDHHAASLDPLVAGIDRGRHKVCEPNIGDEAPAFFHLQRRFFSFFPLGDADFSVEHAGIHANVRDGLGQAERSPPGFAIFSRLRRRGQPHVLCMLLRRAPFVNRRQG